ncbi:MAG: hypothetical protein GXX91_13885 [Verrucomicrobiaceae bacterium]|nr:hypothetical protein [Verrucomicrobiaceae bacterium]
MKLSKRGEYGMRTSRFGADERAEKIRDNTRQIYVGLTRAMERLVVYTSHSAMRYALGARRTYPLQLW